MAGTNEGNTEQDELVLHLALKGEAWLGPSPVDIDPDRTLTQRLNGFVFSLFPLLEGLGGLGAHRLSPQATPAVDLVQEGLHDRWPDHGDDHVEVESLFAAITAVLLEVAAQDLDPGTAMGQLTVGICQVIEDGYVLAAVYFDDDDQFSGLGPNMAPGLAAAMQEKWSARRGYH